jgi:hypothetical protein
LKLKGVGREFEERAGGLWPPSASAQETFATVSELFLSGIFLKSEKIFKN